MANLRDMIPSGPAGEIFLYALMVSVALGFSAIISMLFRQDPRKGEVKERLLKAVTDPFSQAFLLGGPQRALEMAVFSLSRESWIACDSLGRFCSRFRDLSQAPETLTALEKEVVATLIGQGPQSLNGLFQTEFAGLRHLEKKMAAQGYTLSNADYRLGSLLTGSPLLLVVVFGVYRIGKMFLHPPVDDELVTGIGIGMAFALILYFRLLREFSPRTTLGDELTRRLTGELRQRVQNHAENKGEGYDLLWSMKDEILLNGLRTLAGTSFLPLSTFSPTQASPERPADRMEVAYTGRFFSTDGQVRDEPVPEPEAEVEPQIDDAEGPTDDSPDEDDKRRHG